MFRTYKDTVRIPVKLTSSDFPDKREYHCEFCKIDSKYRVWDTEPDVEIHRRQFHKAEILQLLGDTSNFMCCVCLHKQTDKAALIRHIKVHHLLSSPYATRVKRELFICDYCHKVFFNKQLLSVHIEALHLLSADEKKTVNTICPICNFTVPLKSVWFHFLNHGIIHAATCPICVKTFETSNEVLEHVETHPGYYTCCMCLYESKKESLFIKHTETHKKQVDLKGRDDIKHISKYFMPQKRTVSWTSKFLNIFKGITLASDIKICILCQTMCMTDEEMLQHIYGDHSPNVVVEVKRYLCVCGAEFFNNILLKHHIFTLKGDHKASNGSKHDPSGTIQECNSDTNSNTNKPSTSDNSRMLVDDKEITETIRNEMNSDITKNVKEINYKTTDNISVESGKCESEILKPVSQTIEPDDDETMNVDNNHQIYTKKVTTQPEQDSIKTLSSAKNYYEQLTILRDNETHSSDIMELEQLQYNNEAGPADSNEDGSTIIIVEDSSMFS